MSCSFRKKLVGDAHPHGVAKMLPTQNAISSNKATESTVWFDITSFQTKPTDLSTPGAGEPSKKKRFHALDLCAAGLSFICFALAFASVADENLSWDLGVKNYQLTVLGFLLSIMNLCLASVTPGLFLLLESRFGSSKLQNYDGILRNEIFGSRLSIIWRLTLTTMLALPLGLSAAYKQFSGGHSVRQVDARNYIGETPRYGLFAPPGTLYSASSSIGTALFTNATGTFAAASSLQGGAEPPIPALPHAYGYNVLLLNNESTAMLDMPHPDYISTVQQSLLSGESWQMSARVLGTVAYFNNSKATDLPGYNAFLKQAWLSMEASSGAYGYLSSGDSMGLELLTPVGPNNSYQWVGLPPNRGTLSGLTTEDTGVTVSTFSPYAYLFNINRQFCEGTWSITRGGIQLASGSCNGTAAALEYQRVIQVSDDLFFPYYYLETLVELLGAYATTRNQSVWKGPSLSTGMAAMVWSRITTLDSPANRLDPNPLVIMEHSENANQTYKGLGLVYEVDDKATYVRPTLRRSYWLYTVFAAQPILTLSALVLTAVFYSAPVDKDFGLISILAGINHESLEVLSGASLSGQLKSDVKLTMHPITGGGKGTIEYELQLPSKDCGQNGKLQKGVVYH